GVPGRGAQLDKPEQHPDGTFVATGLQEGVYEVHVQSPEHARYRSAEVELRTPPPEGAGRPRGRSGGSGVVYDFGSSMPEAMRFAGGPGQATLEAKTDGKGAFLIKTVPRGTY